MNGVVKRSKQILKNVYSYYIHKEVNKEGRHGHKLVEKESMASTGFNLLQFVLSTIYFFQIQHVPVKQKILQTLNKADHLIMIQTMSKKHTGDIS